MTRQLRIGVPSDVFLIWQGGRDLCRCLYQSIGLAAEPGDSLYLLSPRASRPLRVLKALRRLLLGRGSFTEIGKELREPIGHEIRQAMDLPQSAEVLSRPPRPDHAHADVIGPVSTVEEVRPGLPCIAYIADVQHRHLPDYFSEAERSQRDRTFQGLLHQVPAVVLNSRAVREDIERFYEVGDCRLVVLPMYPAPEADWLQQTPEPQVHGLTGPYFICSNQFWKHKNHKVVLEAIKVLVDEDGTAPMFVFTGKTEDYRDDDYFPSLLRFIEAAGIGDRVKILGLIPKLQQIGLIRGAIALVQPTIFEGGPGGGAVWDAIAVGTRVVVSDIPVNREIPVEEDPLFFPPHSPSDLAIALRAAMQAPARARSNDELAAAGLRRRRACGEAMRQAFEVAIGER